MITVPLLVLSTVLTLQEPPVGRAPQDETQSRSGRPFEQTVAITKGTRIDISDCTGEVVVKTWSRDTVLLRAPTVPGIPAPKATLADKVLKIATGVTTERPRDTPGVELELVVPVWIDLRIEGRECAMEVNGVTGSVTLKNSEGDIVVRGVDGAIDVFSLDGSIEIDGGGGRIKAGSSDGDITITNAAGDIVAESIDGDVHFEDVQAPSIVVTTVDGDIEWTGPVPATAKYRFTSHDGNVSMTIPQNTSAAFQIRRYGGELITDLPLRASGEVRRGRVATYVLGTGTAQIEIESFDGDVELRKPSKD